MSNPVNTTIDLTLVPQQIKMPCATVDVLIDRDAARALISTLQRECLAGGGLEVVRDLPPTNGKGTA